tara:strand:+ start:2121 stop:2708 length:588 start_codon:yes stop_codon:yes gene_type:complete
MRPEHFNETCISSHVKDSTWLAADAIWVLVDFIRSYETSERGTLLYDLSDLYVLFAKKTDDPKHDEYWKSVLDEAQYEKYREIGVFPLAFFKKSQKEYHDKSFVLIDFIDTIVRKNGFAEHLMRRWEDEMSRENDGEQRMLLPQEPIESAVGYWRRILVDICGENDLKFLVNNDVNGVLKWDALLNSVADGIEEM